MCIVVFVCMYILYQQHALRTLKKAPDSLGLELWMVVRLRRVLGIEPRCSLNQWAISLAHNVLFFVLPKSFVWFISLSNMYKSKLLHTNKFKKTSDKLILTQHPKILHQQQNHYQNSLPCMITASCSAADFLRTRSTSSEVKISYTFSTVSSWKSKYVFSSVSNSPIKKIYHSLHKNKSVQSTY